MAPAARQNGVARREALLDAALRCFEKRGLLRTGIEDVRKEAGASPSSVYHLFEDFPALVAALLERTLERRYDQVTTKVLATKTARTAVRTLVEANLTWAFEHEPEAKFLYQALALELDGGHRAKLRAKKLELRERLFSHLHALGVTPPGRPGEAFIDVVLLGPAHQACRAYFANPASVEPKWMLATLPELAWRVADKG